MSYADKIFVDMCRNILDNGTDTKGEKVRPKWDDGSFAYTIKKFGVVNRYDLERQALRIVLMNFFGFGRRSLIMYMI